MSYIEGKEIRERKKTTAIKKKKKKKDYTKKHWFDRL